MAVSKSLYLCILFVGFFPIFWNGRLGRIEGEAAPWAWLEAVVVCVSLVADRGVKSQDRLVSKQAPTPNSFSSFFFKSRSERLKSGLDLGSAGSSPARDKAFGHRIFRRLSFSR
jgi:hypothetical protein